MDKNEKIKFPTVSKGIREKQEYNVAIRRLEDISRISGDLTYVSNQEYKTEGIDLIQLKVLQVKEYLKKLKEVSNVKNKR